MFLGEKLREKSNVFVHFVHLQNIERGFFSNYVAATILIFGSFTVSENKK